MALVGNLKDLKLPSLIQLNCMERNTAKLTIEHDGKYGFIYFEDGQVVHAEYEPDIGEKAVFRLLSLYSGNFKVESGIRAPARTIHTHWNNLLLDGLHQLDSQEEGQDRKYEHLFERLFTVKGVERILIFDESGEVVADSSEEESESPDIYLFNILQSEALGALMQMERPEFMSVVASSKKIVLTSYNQFYVLIEMNAKNKLDIILPLLRQALA